MTDRPKSPAARLRSRLFHLYFVATRAGYSVQVVVGARRDGSGVTGHAWIELDGRPLLEPGEHPEQSFIVMERLPRQ